MNEVSTYPTQCTIELTVAAAQLKMALIDAFGSEKCSSKCATAAIAASMCGGAMMREPPWKNDQIESPARGRSTTNPNLVLRKGFHSDSSYDTLNCYENKHALVVGARTHEVVSGPLR